MNITEPAMQAIINYTALQDREKKEYSNVRLPLSRIKYEGEWENGVVELNQDAMIWIFNFLSSKDILNFSLTHRPAYLLIHNANENFWNQYKKGIVELNFNPGKSIFTCMINCKVDIVKGQYVSTAEQELCNVIDQLFVKKIEPYQTTRFQGCFLETKKITIKQRNDKEEIITFCELLEPAFEIQVGNKGKEIISKWIFRNEFHPSYGHLADKAYQKNDSIPLRITYFNLQNMPSFIEADRFVMNETLENEIFIAIVNSQKKAKLTEKKNFESEDEFNHYAKNQRIELQHLECIQDPFLYESLVYDLTLTYDKNALDADQKKLVNYLKNRNLHKRRDAIVEEYQVIPKSNQYKEIENALDKRIQLISHPSYGKPKVEPKPEVKVIKNNTFNMNTAIALLIVSIATLVIFKG